MLCALSSRKLKAGAWEDFRRAWEPQDGRFPEGFVRAYHVRSIDDPNHVVSFGLLEGSASDVESVRASIGEVEEDRQQRMAEFVEATQLDGLFEVIDEVTPG